MPDDDEFASLVLDEDFVRSALFHEPTARERMLAVAERPTPPPGRPGRHRSAPAARADDGAALSPDELYAAGHPYRGSSTRWHRPVAWALAVVMGIGVVALAFAAVYRGAGNARQPTAPPPSSGPVDTQRLQPVLTTPSP
ncbi:hypothetical protein GA0115240_173014 [Streptomyces sp. DvalAA-14]|uniref:SCO2583/SCO2584 N-terminal domain-containing protein n=1 Tax=unclassified Streptomyces TaxID=2593676 RepID=UPI00081B41D1|nr:MULTISPECIES: hypothetical protein [unclassified Streptomyces]MYS25043.1 hypothetical protein [Streptomyces sp. SID4948]SCE51604.1 hypothetical protein GA0115240_173014 [Streptomyces sp. DvalAA-14]